MLRVICAAALSAAALLPAHAVVAYDESVSGDLPNAGTSALTIPIVLGSNLVNGSTGRQSGVIDRDYFTFTIPAGLQLSALNLLQGTVPLGTLSFIGVQTGTQVTVDPNSGSAEGLLGWTLYGMGQVGTDILPSIGVPDAGSTGFTPPLPAGSYAFWVQETANGVAPYRFDFSVTAVPEPTPALMLAAGLALLALRRRQRG